MTVRNYFYRLTRIFITLLLTAAVLAACRQQTVYRTASGLEYVVYPATLQRSLERNLGSPVVAASGATVKARYTVRHGDSVVRTTDGRLPLYQSLIPGLVYPYSLMEALGGSRAGDSIVVWQRVDSLRSKGLLPHLPKDWKMSDKLVVTINVMRVFPYDYHHPRYTDSAVDADKMEEARQLLAVALPEGHARIAGWLVQHSIAATPDSAGTFVQLLSPGEGPVTDSGVHLGLRYTCTTLSGRVLDANTDTSFHHPAVLPVIICGRSLPPIIDATLRGLRVGSHAKIFLPRGLGSAPAMVAREGGLPGVDMEWEVWLLPG